MTIMSKAKTILPWASGLVALLFSPPIPGWSTVKDNVLGNRMDMAIQSGIAGVTGVQLGGIGGQRDTHVSVGNVLNPVNFKFAPVTKVALWTRGILEVADALQTGISNLIKDLIK